MSHVILYAPEIVLPIVFVIIVIEYSRKKLGCTVTICSLSKFYSFEKSVTCVVIVLLISIKSGYIRKFLFKYISSIQRSIVDHERYNLVVWIPFVPPLTNDIYSCRDICSHIRIPVFTFCSESSNFPPFVLCELFSCQA